jgi:hypothetical protein
LVDSLVRDIGASFELGGGSVDERLMQPLSIGEDFNEVRELGLGLLSGRELPMMDELVLERGDDALRTGVVKAVALTGHTRRDAVVTEVVLVRPGRVLPPLVSVMQQAGVGLRRSSAMVSTSVTISRSIYRLMAHPTIRRANRSTRTARYSHPAPVGKMVSPTRRSWAERLQRSGRARWPPRGRCAATG